MSLVTSLRLSLGSSTLATSLPSENNYGSKVAIDMTLQEFSEMSWKFDALHAYFVGQIDFLFGELIDDNEQPVTLTTQSLQDLLESTQDDWIVIGRQSDVEAKYVYLYRYNENIVFASTL